MIKRREIKSPFSNQGDRAFLSEEDDRLKEVFLINFEGKPYKTKDRLKKRVFERTFQDFQLERGEDFVQKNWILAEISF